MNSFVFPPEIVIHRQSREDDPCYHYAISEARRILKRLGVVSQTGDLPESDFFILRLGNGSALKPIELSEGCFFSDGYAIQIDEAGIGLSASNAKGILNGVYDLAGRLGVAFVLPGESGELLPDLSQPLTVPAGEWVLNPRFKYRGVFAQLEQAKDYPSEEWLRFYAKLRFNAVSHHPESIALGLQLGLRVEVGGHGLAKLLPRTLFATQPDLFRMFQPDDFGGKRQSDSNFCVTNPEAQKIVQENFQKELSECQGAYAVHAWADDLPAGGWCLCPSCRALPPTDQAMLAMRHLGAAIETTGLPIRLPVLAYHDTMLPGRQVDAPSNAFLLFAPRERCYGHAINDPTCARNRFYYQALQGWIEKFSGIDDAHTFEYYFDQILFRGMYPFLPTIILEDMKAYVENGIECHLSLQVGGPEVAPEFNMLVFSQAHWDENLTAQKAIAGLARAILPQAPESLENYLTRRAEAFTRAMRMCDHNLDIYLDYRWLPETVHPFGREMAETYAQSSAVLKAATEALAQGVSDAWPVPVRRWIEKEIKRATFEVAELQVMSHQQSAMNQLGLHHNSGSPEHLAQAKREMHDAITAFEQAKVLAIAAGISQETWYCRNVNDWIRKELEQKLMRWS